MIGKFGFSYSDTYDYLFIAVSLVLSVYDHTFHVTKKTITFGL